MPSVRGAWERAKNHVLERERESSLAMEDYILVPFGTCGGKHLPFGTCLTRGGKHLPTNIVYLGSERLSGIEKRKKRAPNAYRNAFLLLLMVADLMPSWRVSRREMPFCLEGSSQKLKLMDVLEWTDEKGRCSAIGLIFPPWKKQKKKSYELPNGVACLTPGSERMRLLPPQQDVVEMGKLQPVLL